MGLSAAGTAYAWNDFGHMEVAAAAWKQLTPAARQRATALLRLNPRYGTWVVGAKRGDEDRNAFMRAATWADALKSDKQYREDDQFAPTAARNIGYADELRHLYWHFVDQPFSPDGTALLPATAPNVATQIAAFVTALNDPAVTDEVKSFDLSWLLHLVGDVHQPLHCVSRFEAAHPRGDRGGNAVAVTGNTMPAPCDDPRVCPYGPPPDLHALWDSVLGAGYAVEPPAAAAARLPKPDAAKVAVVDPTRWIGEGAELAKTVVYAAPIGVGAGPFAVDTAYEAAATKLAQQQVALAGGRLARLLNAALGGTAAKSGGEKRLAGVAAAKPAPRAVR